jgi:hypothetical protein
MFETDTALANEVYSTVLGTVRPCRHGAQGECGGDEPFVHDSFRTKAIRSGLWWGESTAGNSSGLAKEHAFERIDE